MQAWDRYAYANNSPVLYNDPSGHCVGPGGHDFPDGSPACDVVVDEPTPPFVPPVTDDEQPNDDPTPNDLPYSQTLHPFNDQFEKIPVYDYSTFPPTLLGYKYTYYQLDYSTIKFDILASDSVPAIVPLGAAALLNAAGVTCPFCNAVLITWSAASALNNAITVKGYLQERFINMVPFLPLDPFTYKYNVY